MSSKLVLKRKDYIAIEQDPRVGLQPSEDYALTTAKVHGEWVRSIHVFRRRPTQQELQVYEETASRVKLKGNKASLEGKRLLAAKVLYDLLIDRVIDAQIGRKTVPFLEGNDARVSIEPLMKRAAIIDMVSEVYSASQLEEREGEGPEDDESKEED